MDLPRYYYPNEGDRVNNSAPPSYGGGFDLDPDTAEILGRIGGTAFNYGARMTPMGDIPGLVGAASALGRGASPAEAGMYGLRSATSEVTANIVRGLLPGVPLAGTIAGAAAGEALSPSPNVGAAISKAGLSGFGSLLGSAVAPGFGTIVGGILGGYLAKESLENGFLGDWNDTRDREAERDYAEDKGYSVRETERMAERDRALPGNAFGLSAANEDSTRSALERGAGDNPFGYDPDKSTTLSALEDAARDIDWGADDIGDFGSDSNSNDSSSSDRGTGSQGHDDGEQGDDGGFGR